MKTKYVVTLLMISFSILVFLNSGCALLGCIEIGSKSPRQLLDDNEIVVLGSLESFDTLIPIGNFERFGNDYEVYVLEYCFKVEESFSETLEGQLIYLWFIGIKNEDFTNFLSSPRNEAQDILIYGNKIESRTDIPKIMQSVTLESLSSIESAFNGSNIDIWNTIDFDTAVYEQIISHERLDTLLSVRIESGIVIYATDNYYTHSEFNENDIDYCDISLPFDVNVTKEKYIVRLREFSSE